MPATLTYPGVYIEEIPSGVHTITGVATSITAFLGRAARGPTWDPRTINNYGDFVRQFGGLDPNYPMSYAVRDFYQNGGSQALIVRLSTADGGNATLTDGDFVLQAASTGLWGNNLFMAVDYDGITQDVADRYQLKPEDLFNLTVVEFVNGAVSRAEQFRSVAWAENQSSPRRIDRVLAQESSLVRLGTKFPAARPKESAAVTSAGATGAGNGSTGTPSGGGTGGGAAGGGETTGGGTTAAGGTTAITTTGSGSTALTTTTPAGPPPVVTSTGRKLSLTPADKDSGKDSKALQQADLLGDPDKKTGLFALDKADLFNLLCIPPDTRGGDTDAAVYQAAMQYCATRRAMLIVDPPAAWSANTDTAAQTARDGLGALNLSGPAARNAALYFPRVLQADPARDGQTDTFPACGIVAGVMARTDATRGVWKAPAGLDAALSGIQGLEVNLTNDENGMLNPLGINCLRAFPVNGTVIWGARTLRGADQLADEYKYIPVRRLALFIEESLYRGTQWVVFEPNDEPLWAQIRLNVGAFMHDLFRQGAFQGSTPRDAYFVKCDKESTTQNDINLGIVNVVVGFAPLKPAEFVVIQLQQMAGQIDV